MDWVGWLDLCDRDDNAPESLELEITKTRWWEAPFLAVAHPDPIIRMSGLLGLLSIGLGIWSVVLTLMD